MSNLLLQCQNISKVFGQGHTQVNVLSNINLEICKGELIAVVGSSGSGKSTLLHILGGLDKPTTGDISLAQQPLAQLNEKALCSLRNQHLGFIYQFHHLLPEFTALENVCMPLLIRGEKITSARSAALDLLEQVGLSQRIEHKLHQLSGGERQRVAICRALVGNPSCILADEPTGNLDEKTAAQVFDMLLTLQKERQTSIIMVTHDMRLAEKADRVMTLQAGELVE